MRAKYKWQWRGIALAMLVFLIQIVVPKSLIDNYYYKGIYQVWRSLWDATFSLSPIPLVYLLFLLLLGYILYNLIYSKITWKGSLIKTLGVLGWSYAAFYLLWGLNYQNPTIKDKLVLKAPIINDSILISNLGDVIDELNALRVSIQVASFDMSTTEINDEVRLHLTSLLADWGLPTSGKVKVRSILPKGVLLRFSTAGIYLPFISEGHIDEGLHKLQWPSTIAHEMSHGYGVMDEGECNFVGALACLDSSNEYIRYSGLIMYYRYLRSALRRNKEATSIIKDRLSDAVRSDLDDIRNTLNQYPDILPKVRNLIYDWYLKRNGVKAGIKSYGRVIQLFISYEQQFGSII